MSHTIHAENVNDALSAGLWWLKTTGVLEDSRNGPVLVSPVPVMTEYSHPQERVLFGEKRHANHVFHLMEALWMIAGSNDIKFLLPFNARMESYAENGIQWGAYGRRWRHWFGHDQIKGVVNELHANPNSRRAVIGMWDPYSDLTHIGPDVPCNVSIFFDLRMGALNMTVCCRSNDILWGAYGTNVVHFSILQELIAHELRVNMGVYRQFSNNYHIYTDLPMAKDLLAHPPDAEPYKGYIFPLLDHKETLADFTNDCKNLILGDTDMQTYFMRNIALPLMENYLKRKAGQEYSTEGTSDWHKGFKEWCEHGRE